MKSPYVEIKTNKNNFFVINPETGNWVISPQTLGDSRLDELDISKTHQFLEDRLDMLILNTTKKCNLGCIYCSNGEKDVEDMSIEVGKKIIERVEELNPKQMRVVFHGNEPLMNFGFIKQFSYLARNSAVPFRLSLQTNGTVFTDEIFDYLENQGIELSFSMDGDKKIHDLQRPYKNSSKGSFSILESNIERVRSFQDYLAPITVVTKNNVSELSRLYDLFKSKNYARVQFTLVEPLGYATNSSLIPDSNVLFNSMKNVFEKNLEDIKDGSSFRVRNLTTILGNFFQPTRPLACTSCGVNKLYPLAVDLDGSYYPCDTMWGNKKYYLGSIYTTSILDAVRSKNNPRNAKPEDVGSLIKKPFFNLHTNGCPSAVPNLKTQGPYFDYYEKMYSYLATRLEEFSELGLIQKVLR